MGKFRLTQSSRSMVILSAALWLTLAPTALRAAKKPEPVAAVPTQGFRMSTPQGSAVDPYIISLDWSKPQSQITRAVIIFHGKGRDVEGYYRTLLEAADSAGLAARDTIFIAPQFLDAEDADAHHLPGDVLRWHSTDWESGASALAPFPLSSYEVVDAMLARLGDRSLFPNLKTVVLAGHSGGGQLIQRYAIVGRPLATLAQNGIHLRFVIANPSSYVYFNDERPSANGTLAPFQSGACSGFNHWKYGPIATPAYIRPAVDKTWAQMEADYAKRDVTYLLGTDDTDPHEKDLDVSCAGEAQGPTRFSRGQAYYTYLHNRNSSDWNQRMWFVPGVAHSAHKMFTSQCGVYALFENGRCPDQ
jgi:pimeloyl-ACP methyl ester carboxylesterase